MPRSFTQLLYYIVFSTKNREPWLTDDIAPRCHAYMRGVIHNEGGAAIAVGGVEDHVHLLVRCKPDARLSDLVRSVKAGSSRWIHETRDVLAAFAWQDGFSAFSVSVSNCDAVAA